MDSDRSRRLIESGLLLAADGVSLDGVLDRVVELAMDVTQARYGALGILTDDGTIERFLTRGVTDEERAAIGDPPTGRGLLGILIREGHALRLADIGRDPRSVGFPPNHPPMRSFLGAPVVAHGRVFGRIYLTEKHGGRGFTEDDERAVVVLAAQAGTAIENARLHEETERQHREIERLRVSEERERIAKELHDGVIQSLFAVGMGLQGAGAIAHEPEVVRRIEGAVDEIDRAIRDLRNYIFGLRPGVLADRQLDTALAELAQEFQERSDVVTVVDVDGTIAAELAGHATDVVQLTRELLSNVARHAKAATCRVSLSPDEAGALLVVDDDGAGFDPEDVTDGMGLANVRARAGSLGGTLEIVSAAGSGTTVRVTIPL
ncbi:MAG TPA: GAF domain-containing sensor histidine kinase [Actinomycetota bacterium]|nr:GAF domain-containing sensor histidine kinase [Actinomycetota bacterium]